MLETTIDKEAIVADLIRLAEVAKVFAQGLDHTREDLSTLDIGVLAVASGLTMTAQHMRSFAAAHPDKIDAQAARDNAAYVEALGRYLPEAIEAIATADDDPDPAVTP